LAGRTFADDFSGATTCVTTGRQSPVEHLSVRAFVLRQGAALAIPRPITKNNSSAKRFMSFPSTLSEDEGRDTGSKTSFEIIE